MILNQKQEEGLRLAVARYKAHEPYTVIAGLAGTGKSELIKFIIAELGLGSGEVAYAAFTGKAAQVLRQKGCAGACTAHKLLYRSVPGPNGGFRHFPKYRHELEHLKLIVVDEVSMLPKKMWDLLLTYGIPVIAAGDPQQLPAISDPTTVLDRPDIFLDEIMRQEADNEIIQLSMDIRNGKMPSPQTRNQIMVVRKQDVIPSMYTWADQIICGTNSTRRKINKEYRKMEWGEDLSEPCPLDKIVCLRNNWDEVNPAGEALVNGMVGRISELSEERGRHYLGFTPEGYDDVDIDPAFNGIYFDWQLITTGNPTVNKDNFRKFKKGTKNPPPDEFDYGYCITCWKSQGSEYDKVLFFAERLPFLDPVEYKQFLYTGVTRAAKKLVMVI